MWASRQADASLYKDPEGRRLMLAETRRTVQQMHPDVARRLHLTAEEANQLLDLMSEHMMRRREGFASGDNTFSQESFEERLRAHDADLAALLGSERFQRFETYKQSLPERRRVNAFRAELDQASALNEETGERLISALASERLRAQAEAGPESADDPDTMVWGIASGGSVKIKTNDPNLVESATAQLASHDKRMAQAAAPTLSTAQFQAFTEFQRQRRDAQVARLRVTSMDMEESRRKAQDRDAQR